MFVVTLTYVKPLAEIDALIPAHIAWLERQYAAGHFLASGRRVPRVGGVILAQGVSRDALEAMLAEDPFHKPPPDEKLVGDLAGVRRRALD